MGTGAQPRLWVGEDREAECRRGCCYGCRVAGVGPGDDDAPSAARLSGEKGDLLGGERGAADVEAMRREYDQRRQILLAGLKRLGFPMPAEPRGAYYVYVTRLTQ